MVKLRNEVRGSVSNLDFSDAAKFEVSDKSSMLIKASKVGVLATENEDIRSLRELIIYGVKGMSAYAHHAFNLGKENNDIYSFIYEAMAATLNDKLSADELVAL
ncbi:MAG: hydroxylamine reductase, partial [Cetobacterium sp.]